jgi:hypothetical protein
MSSKSSGARAESRRCIRLVRLYPHPTERQPLPNRLVRLLSEARWLALAVLGLYFVLILASYNKMDPGWSHGTLVPRCTTWAAAPAPGCPTCCCTSSAFPPGGGRFACCAWCGRAIAA